MTIDKAAITDEELNGVNGGRTDIDANILEKFTAKNDTTVISVAIGLKGTDGCTLDGGGSSGGEFSVPDNQVYKRRK